jgi:hypothetical protein
MGPDCMAEASSEGSLNLRQRGRPQICGSLLSNGILEFNSVWAELDGLTAEVGAQ